MTKDPYIRAQELQKQRRRDLFRFTIFCIVLVILTVVIF